MKDLKIVPLFQKLPQFFQSGCWSCMGMGLQLTALPIFLVLKKIDRVALLITEPPPANSTTLKRRPLYVMTRILQAHPPDRVAES